MAFRAEVNKDAASKMQTIAFAGVIIGLIGLTLCKHLGIIDLSHFYESAGGWMFMVGITTICIIPIGSMVEIVHRTYLRIKDLPAAQEEKKP